MKKSVHVVAAIIANDKGEILCAKRSSEMSLANYWEFPGGKVEDGESKQSALRREIKEELNCLIEVFQQVEDTIYEYDGVIVRLETFMSKIISGTPIAKEHEKIAWISRDKLHQLRWAPADIPAVRKVEKLCMKEFMKN